MDRRTYVRMERPDWLIDWLIDILVENLTCECLPVVVNAILDESSNSRNFLQLRFQYRVYLFKFLLIF